MNKDEIVNALQEDPKMLMEVALELDLYFKFDKLSSIRKYRNEYAEYLERIYELKSSDEGKADKDLQERLQKDASETRHYINKIDELYGAMAEKLEYDKNEECRWLPDEYSDMAKDVFEFRKEMYDTQSINEDYRLDKLVQSDIDAIYGEVGGQEGMYDNMPIVREFKDDSNGRRVYALNSCGGVAIINDNRIVTLGEDDGYFFLNGRCIYENFYGESESFYKTIKLALDKAIGAKDTNEGQPIVLSQKEKQVLSGILIDTIMRKTSDKDMRDVAYSISEKMMDSENKSE